MCLHRSLELEPSCTAYANRAMARLKLKQYKRACDDCTSALNLDARYLKAWQRRATAYREMGQHCEALRDFEEALR